MSHTRITYRGSTLFVLGNIGTLILNIFILIWCLVWLGVAIIVVCDPYEVDDFFDALPIIIGFVVGIGGSMATIWNMTSEIRDVKIERLEKKITKLESGKPNKIAAWFGIENKQSVDTPQTIKTLKDELARLKRLRDLDNGKVPEQQNTQNNTTDSIKLHIPNPLPSPAKNWNAETVKLENRKAQVLQEYNAVRQEMQIAAATPEGKKHFSELSVRALNLWHESEQLEKAIQSSKGKNAKKIQLYTPTKIFSPTKKESITQPNTQETIHKNTPYTQNLAAEPREEQGRVDYAKIEDAEELARVVTAEMEGDIEAAKDYLTMKKKAAESALKSLKHKDDEDSATFLATRKKEQALQNEVNRWNTAITALNTI